MQIPDCSARQTVKWETQEEEHISEAFQQWIRAAEDTYCRHPAARNIQEIVSIFLNGLLFL